MTPHPEQIGKYRIRSQVGSGAMGVVYLAVDADLRREVAIKVLSCADDDDRAASARFINEARMLAVLSNPHIVQIHDYAAGPPPFLAMEYVRGQSLRALLTERGGQPAAVVIDCAAQLLDGLAAAHEAGILHRDIKPANVLLSERGVFKLADFGLARRAGDSSDLTSTGMLVGTLRYFAPELINDCVATVASDLYALGMTLIELAGGSNPFAAPGPQIQRLARILEQPLPPVQHLAPALPAAMATWLDRMVARDPQARFASARAALAALPGGATPAGGVPSFTPSSGIVAGEPSSATVPMGIGSITATLRPRSVTSSGVRRTKRLSLRPTPYRLAAQLILVMWLVAASAATMTAWLVAHGASERQLDDLRDHLRDAAATAALLVDGNAQGYLAADPRMETEAWTKVRSGLRAFRTANPDVANLLTMARLSDTTTSGVVLITCDDSDGVDENGNGVIDPQEEMAVPGARFDAKPSPQLIRGFTAPAVDDEPTRDNWGVWLSAYAPIRNSSGMVTGIVVIDVPAERFDTVIGSAQRQVIIVLVPILLLTLVFAVVFAHRLNRPLADIQQALVAAAAGDFSRTAPVTHGPFAVVSTAVNHLLAELRGTMELRSALLRVLTHAITRRTDEGSGADGACAVLSCRLGEVDGPTLAARLTVLIDAVREHDGMPERIAGNILSVVFPVRPGSNHPQERAIRVALIAVQEGDERHPRPLFGIATDLSAAKATDRADALCRANLEFGTDLLVGEGEFTPLRQMFIADRLTLAGGVPAYAIKGTVS